MTIVGGETAEEGEERITRWTRWHAIVLLVHRFHPWKKGATWGRGGGGEKCHEAEPKLRPEVAGHVTGATRDIVRRHNKPLSSSSSSLLSLRRRREERRWFMTGFEAIASNRPTPSPPPFWGYVLPSLWDSMLSNWNRSLRPFSPFVILARCNFLEIVYLERSKWKEEVQRLAINKIVRWMEMDTISSRSVSAWKERWNKLHGRAHCIVPDGIRLRSSPVMRYLALARTCLSRMGVWIFLYFSFRNTHVLNNNYHRLLLLFKY